ncbi:PAS domain-containing protein [Bacillus sp. SL00103]
MGYGCGSLEIRSIQNEFTWTDDFRKMLGFQNEHDFPNVLDSWASRIHPDEQEYTLNAFCAFYWIIRDVHHMISNIKVEKRDYRWFKATGDHS